jgi:hypothetical protein
MLKIITNPDEIKKLQDQIRIQKVVSDYKEIEEIYDNKDWKKLNKLAREEKKKCRKVKKHENAAAS